MSYFNILLSLLVILASTSVHSQSTAPGKWFDRIFIIIFENMAFDTVYNNPDWKGLSDQGRLFTNYYAITHPSQPNYWSMVAGDYFGETTDNSIDMPQKILTDLMDAKGISWKNYEEAYPGNCFLSDQYPYNRRHNPFISFAGVRLNATDCAKVVNSDQFAIDLSNNALPQYSYFSPGEVNNGHDSGTAFAGQYTKGFFQRFLPQFPPGTLIVVTWDEDDYKGTNHIYTFLLGSMIPAGTTDDTKLNHYSLLKTVEDNWDLGNLGRNDINATAYSLPAANGTSNGTSGTPSGSTPSGSTPSGSTSNGSTPSGLIPPPIGATLNAEARGMENLLFLLLLLVGNWVCFLC